MAIERGDIEGLDSEEGSEERETREREERQAAIDAERKARHEAELARAKAEGELEALRRTSAPPQGQPQAAWTDEQWETEGQKYGMSGQALKVANGLASGHAELVAQKTKADIDAVRKEATEARADARKAREERGLYDVERDFYANNPELAGRKGDVAEFMALLPEETKNDPKKYGDALAKAKVYAVGKAKESLSSRRNGGERTRVVTDNPRMKNDEVEADRGASDDQIDPRGFKKGEVRLLEDLLDAPGGFAAAPKNAPLDEMDLEKAYAACETYDKKGVEIDSEAEFYRGNEKMERALKNPDTILKTNEEQRSRRGR